MVNIESNFKIEKKVGEERKNNREEDLLREIEALSNKLHDAKETDKEKLDELLADIAMVFEENGMLENDYNNVLNIARAYPECIVRREDPRALFEAIVKDVPFKIEFDGGSEYPNGAVLGNDGSGLRVPYEWGFSKLGKGEAVLVVGIKQGDDLSVRHLADTEGLHYGNAEARSNMRVVSGRVFPDNLVFTILRVPLKLLEGGHFDNEKLGKTKQFGFILFSRKMKKGTE